MGQLWWSFTEFYSSPRSMVVCRWSGTSHRDTVSSSSSYGTWVIIFCAHLFCRIIMIRFRYIMIDVAFHAGSYIISPLFVFFFPWWFIAVGPSLAGFRESTTPWWYIYTSYIWNWITHALLMGNDAKRRCESALYDAFRSLPRSSTGVNQPVIPEDLSTKSVTL